MSNFYSYDTLRRVQIGRKASEVSAGRLILAMEKQFLKDFKVIAMPVPLIYRAQKTTWDALKIPEVSPWDLADAGVNPITTRSVF